MSNTRQSLLSILVHDLKDRLQGNRHRANARWGLVTPPQGKSKLIWIRAGSSRDSVMLAAGLMAAIRNKRLDARLVLTYEEEYPDIIVEHLSGLNKIGFGYSSANNSATEARMLTRLSPFAIIFVGEPAGTGIQAALIQHPVSHIINFQTTAVAGINPEIALENFISSTTKAYCVEAMSLLVQAQVDTQLGALLQGSQERPVFLLSADQHETFKKIVYDWKNSALYNSSILCVCPSHFSADEIRKLAVAITDLGLTVKYFSQWDRGEAAQENEVFVLDEWRWFAATAASSLAIHLLAPDQGQFWQSLASATVVSCGADTDLPVENVVPSKSSQEIIGYWQQLSQDAMLCRKVGDDNRRLFWNYRRAAQQAVDGLLQKVFDW